MNRFSQQGDGWPARSAPWPSLCLLCAAPAGAGSLVPRGNKVFFGISDTGDSADFGQFSSALHKHPALIESFRTWGSDFPESIERWQAARARPVLHITTADNNDGHELITPRGIATGAGDEYLIRLNKLFWAKKMRAYIRPLGEPNRCLNVYASYDCAGEPRDAAHSTRWYKRAFRRIYVIVHGGGKRAQIDARLREAGLPPLQQRRRRPAQGAGRGDLEPAAGRLADRPPQPPPPLLPRRRWVDWAGTDFYSDNQDWKALDGLYRRYSRQALRDHRVGRLHRRRLRLRAQADDLGRPPPPHQDARLLPGLRLDQLLPDPELPGQPRRAAQQIHHAASLLAPLPQAPPPPPGGVAPARALTARSCAAAPAAEVASALGTPASRRDPPARAGT